MIQLRDYQKQIISKIRTAMLEGHKRIVMCSPTGSGKTIMFTFMVAEHIKKGGNVLIFTHRKELLKQTGNVFQNFELQPTFIVANEKSNLQGNLHVGMVETFYRRLENGNDFAKMLQKKTLVIIDECHLESFTKLFAFLDTQTYVIGASATPYRKSQQTSLNEFYTAIIQELDTPELILKGFLAKCRTFGVKINMKNIKRKGDDFETSEYYTKNKIFAGVVDNYLRIAAGLKTIVFASNVNSSIELCEEFNNRGIIAKHVDADTPSIERNNIFSWFSVTPNAVLCNCGIATTGFDEPSIRCVILYMATTSIIKYLQCAGRGSRVLADKNEFYLLDFGNNVERLGFWENGRVWSLEKKEKKEGISPIKYCSSCSAIISKSAKECQFCGYVFPKTKEEIKEKVHVELEEMIKKFSKKELFNLANNGSLDTKAYLCKQKHISPFFILHQLTDINEARKFIKLMGWKHGFEYQNKNRFKVFQNTNA
jgi:superfamily II DNA or RNA helicase